MNRKIGKDTTYENQNSARLDSWENGIRLQRVLSKRGLECWLCGAKTREEIWAHLELRILRHYLGRVHDILSVSFRGLDVTDLSLFWLLAVDKVISVGICGVNHHCLNLTVTSVMKLY